ncbi:FeoB-associated Cys-rich membrane protein [Betaproteobacteria bacterium PRO7]|jgi:hypothetical protein|nr:FeoB-associated Cys-rich membrane protein [Betaproteobacteria bacterium PRO7]
MTAYELFETAAIALAVVAAARYAFVRLRAAATTAARAERTGCSSGCDGCSGCPPPTEQRIRFVAQPRNDV